MISSKKSTKKNYIYNLSYHLLSLLTPLIVMPYISRVLGNYGVGQYAFTYSLITYFVLFASLGFEIYAQREIARFQGNKKEQTKVFWEIIIARSISTFLTLCIHIALILSNIYGETYTILMWILTVNILAVFFDISLLFRGNEDFGLLSLVASIFKIGGVVSIILFVKNESHLWLYTFLQSIILVASNLSMWIFLPKYLVRLRGEKMNINRHFIPCIRLFIPTIAVSVYTVLDKTLIGLMVPGTIEINGVEKSVADIENGNYEQAEKIVKMAMMIITSLGTVMIPKNSSIIESGDFDKFKSNIDKALKFVFYLGSPITLGVLAISQNFAPWFFGEGYEKVPFLMMMFSPLILIIGVSNVIGLQYLLPLKKDRKYTLAILSGAFTNLLLNLILIPFLKSFGACIATIVGEIVVTSVMLLFAKKDVTIIKSALSMWKPILSSCIMFAAVFTTQFFLTPSILNTILLVFEGIIVFLVVNIIFREETMIKTIRRIFKR